MTIPNEPQTRLRTIVVLKPTLLAYSQAQNSSTEERLEDLPHCMTQASLHAGCSQQLLMCSADIYVMSAGMQRRGRHAHPDGASLWAEVHSQGVGSTQLTARPQASQRAGGSWPPLPHLAETCVVTSSVCSTEAGVPPICKVGGGRT